MRGSEEGEGQGRETTLETRSLLLPVERIAHAQMLWNKQSEPALRKRAERHTGSMEATISKRKKNKTTNSLIGSQRVSRPAAPLTKHTQDTVNIRYNTKEQVRIPCVLFPKMENATSLKKQSPKALSACAATTLNYS